MRRKHPDTDYHAADGMFYAGWRKVRKGGIVSAGGVIFQSDRLLPLVGQKVWVAMNDYWMQEARIGRVKCHQGYGDGWLIYPQKRTDQ